MWVGIVSLFPEMLEAAAGAGVLGRAVAEGVVDLDLVNPRSLVRPDQAQALLLDRLGLRLPERLRAPPHVDEM